MQAKEPKGERTFEGCFVLLGLGGVATFMAFHYEQKRITAERAMNALARMTRRGTLTPEWIHSAVKIVSEIRRKGED